MDYNVKLNKYLKFKNGKKRLDSFGVYPLYGGNGKYGTSNNYNADNSIIIGRVGAYCGSVYLSESKCWISDNAISAELINKEDDLYYFYYLLNMLNLNFYSIGTSQPLLTQSIIKNLKVNIAERKNQKIISAILLNYDKKIETNNKIIANLEAQAQALFKYYFVDFEPFVDGKFVDSDLGPIPEGWEISNLEKIANYRNGVAIKKFPPKDKENSLPALKIRELNKNSTDESSDLVGTYIDDGVRVYDGDVIFSWSGTLLVKIWTGGDAGLNQHLFKVTSLKYDKWFYYLWTLYHLEKFIAIARDKATTMGHIKRSHLKESEVLICDEKTYREIDEVLNPIIELITNLGIQNRYLAETRDALLPKLMAGEIDLENLGGPYD